MTKLKTIDRRMVPIIFGLLYFIFIFLIYILPIAAFVYGSYIFFTQRQYFESILFIITAVGFLVIFLSRRTSLSSKKIEWLKIHGKKIITKFKALDRRWNTKINGESPFIIYTELDGRIFESEDLWFSNGDNTFSINDASFRAWQTLQSKDPSKKYLIPVYVNPKKNKEYYMDVGGLEVE